MKQSGTTAHIVLTFIGASTFVSPLTRNTVMKAGQAGKFDRADGEKLQAREMFDATGKTRIPYFREEDPTASYAFDFTAAWAKAGNTPRVSDLNNKPLVPETASAAPATDPAEEAVPIGKVETEDTTETTETEQSQESTATDTGAAGGEGTESTDETDEESDETTETATEQTAAATEKPAVKTTQRRSRTK